MTALIVPRPSLELIVCADSAGHSLSLVRSDEISRKTPSHDSRRKFSSECNSIVTTETACSDCAAASTVTRLRYEIAIVVASDSLI